MPAKRYVHIVIAGPFVIEVYDNPDLAWTHARTILGADVIHAEVMDQLAESAMDDLEIAEFDDSEDTPQLVPLSDLADVKESQHDQAVGPEQQATRNDHRALQQPNDDSADLRQSESEPRSRLDAPSVARTRTMPLRGRDRSETGDGPVVIDGPRQGIGPTADDAQLKMPRTKTVKDPEL